MKQMKLDILMLSHNPKSHSAKLLSKRFGRSLLSITSLVDYVRMLPPEEAGKMTVINWGSSKVNLDLPNIKRVLNPASRTSPISNKLTFFEMCAAAENGPRIPPFWKSSEEALEQMQQNPKWSVIGRDERGSCGLDIRFFEDDPDAWNSSDFFVKYIPKKDEYRLHVFKYSDGYTVLTQQRKALRALDPVTGEEIDKDKVNFKVRNHRNGFIFQRQNVAPPQDVFQQGLRAMEVSGLDFGAVDIIWNEKSQKAYVLEINTAPGLEGSTVNEYASAFKHIAAE